jgi:hypothetical protein
VDAFSYLSVLLSIIIGLGVTQVLTALGRLIRHRDLVRMDWLPLVWAGVMLVIFVQVWWSMFGLRMYRDWTFFGFLLVLSQTCTLYMMAALVLPEQIEEPSVDLAAHYDRQQRWFFGFLLATLVISVVKDLVMNGHWPSAVNLGFHALLAATCLVAILVRRRRVHEVIGVAVPAVMVAYIALLFMRLR